MSSLAIASSRAASLAAQISHERLGSARQTLVFGIGFQIAMLIPSLAAFVLDERLVNAINVWTKPLKFQISLSINMLTMLFLLPLLSAAWRSSRTVRWSAVAVAFTGALEIAYIVLQASRGRPSHYNFLTPTEAFMYQMMGVGSVVLVLGPLLLALAIWRSPSADHRGLRMGAVLGLTIGAVLTLITAGYLSSGVMIETGRWVDGVRNDASGLPILGWSMVGGDLRVSHFFATHTMQALPLMGLFADRFAPGKYKMLVLASAAICIAIVALTFLQARSGMPFLVL
jgi:hypothetical protein